MSAMTDPLAETIERVIAAPAVEETDMEVTSKAVLCSDIDALLSTARRVMAMEAVGGSHVIGRALNALDCRTARFGTSYAELESADLQALIDIAAERVADWHYWEVRPDGTRTLRDARTLLDSAADGQAARAAQDAALDRAIDAESRADQAEARVREVEGELSAANGEIMRLHNELALRGAP